MEQLANPLSQQAGKWLVIPKGEGDSSSLREFHVKFHRMNRLYNHKLASMAHNFFAHPLGVKPASWLAAFRGLL